MKRINYLLICSIAAIGVLAACKSSSKDAEDAKWTCDATVEGAAGEDAVIYAPDASGKWIALDTVTASADGKFTFSLARLPHPEILRVTIGGNTVYLPADSTETITLTGNIADLESNYTIAGSNSASMMHDINTLLMKAPEAEADSTLKREIASVMQRDWGSIASYYALIKTVNKRPVFDPNQKFDRRIISAVANGFNTAHPDDPRTEMLKNNALELISRYSTSTNPTYAEELPLIDISLLDDHGKRISLLDTWNDSKVTVLNFTVYGAQPSAQFNNALHDVYNKYSDRGLQIYQVSCDDNESTWRNTAINLPWITVYSYPEDGADHLINYNVATVPTTFVFNHDATRVERVDDIADLQKVVESMMK